MKLTIGENIRNFRKENGLTQEALADRLGVTYQSISRWENGTTYPDLELLPAISEVLAVTVDELLGMPQIEKEKRAIKAFDELRRECMKQDYDAERIVTLLRDIRINYINSDSAWRPWSEGNERAFRDPKILPEVRLFAEAYLKLHPMYPHVLQSMAEFEDEENIEAFLKKHTTSFDCSSRALLFRRYLYRGDAERFEPERRYQLYHTFNNLLYTRNLIKWGEDKSKNDAADEFMEAMLSLIRSDAVDDRPDMWVSERIDFGINCATRKLALGNETEALSQLEKVVNLLEETMKISDEILLPTSCRFLDGMEWHAKESWDEPDNDPDRPKERTIFIYTKMNQMTSCFCIYPSCIMYYLQGDDFVLLHNNPKFKKLCDRVKSLIITENTNL